jgi:hypothetical protein
MWKSQPRYFFEGTDNSKTETVDSRAGNFSYTEAKWGIF